VGTAADKDVRDAVEKALKADKNLEGIEVKSVENGLVRAPRPRSQG
jgi:hypothetical protein